MSRPGAPVQTERTLFAGRYELLDLLARGGMGDIWRARHLPLDRIVAVKRLREVDADASKRLLNEARTLGQLRHRAIVQVHDCGVDDAGAPFLVMELLEGQSLAEHLAEHGRLGAVRAVRLLLPVLEGLIAAHDAGIVHRDLKPENIMLVPAAQGLTPVLVDFGIAHRRKSEQSRLTQVGTFVGTPAYMAPEQILGLVGDARTDVWGLTTVIYEAASGSVPFSGETREELFRAVSFTPPPFPAHVPDLDGRLWAILMRGLCKLPEQRFASCLELERELRAWLTRHEQGGSPTLGDAPSDAAPQVKRTRASSDAPTKSATDLPMDTLIRGQRSKR